MAYINQHNLFLWKYHFDKMTFNSVLHIFKSAPTIIDVERT